MIGDIKLKITIDSDRPTRTSVVDEATGRALACRSLSIIWEGGRPRVTIEVVDFEVEVRGTAHVYTVCPKCKQDR